MGMLNAGGSRITEICSIKKGDIAPLQPDTLASFRTWGSSQGAGRIALVQRYNDSFVIQNYLDFAFQ
jgi:hypothetical protein